MTRNIDILKSHDARKVFRTLCSICWSPHFQATLTFVGHVIWALVLFESALAVFVIFQSTLTIFILWYWPSFWCKQILQFSKNDLRFPDHLFCLSHGRPLLQYLFIIHKFHFETFKLPLLHRLLIIHCLLLQLNKVLEFLVENGGCILILNNNRFLWLNCLDNLLFSLISLFIRLFVIFSFLWIVIFFVWWDYVGPNLCILNCILKLLLLLLRIIVPVLQGLLFEVVIWATSILIQLLFYANADLASGLWWLGYGASHRFLYDLPSF